MRYDSAQHRNGSRELAAPAAGISLALFTLAMLSLLAILWPSFAFAQTGQQTTAQELRSVSAALLLVASDGDDMIRISSLDDGSLSVLINDRATVVPAADVSRLVIDALEGDDTIIAQTGMVQPLTILGGPGNDKIFAGAGDDYVDGGTGNDLLFGGAGNDVLYGGPGNDVLTGAGDADYLDGGPGNDMLTGGPGSDVLFGGAGDDSLSGGDDPDMMAGGPGVDSFVGGPGLNKTFAQRSDDQPFGSPGAVTWVNPAPLGAGDQLAGSNIVDEDDLAFSDRVRSDLQSLLSIPSGRRLLQGIDRAGKRVTLHSDESRCATTILDTAAAMLRDDGTPGTGSACTIAYNLTGTVVGNGSEAWMHRPPMVGLAHELVHAMNATSGTLQAGQSETGVPKLELQAIGLPFDGIAWDNDGDPTTPSQSGNLSSLTENGFRALFGLAERPRY